MALSKRLGLIAFIVLVMGLCGDVVNRHLDSPWEKQRGELPVAVLWSLVLAAGVFAVCWFIGVLAGWVRRALSATSPPAPEVGRCILALFLLVAFTLAAVWWWAAETQRRRAADFYATAEDLERIYAEPEARDRIEVLAGLAANRNTPSDVLLDLALAGAPELDRPRRNLSALFQGYPTSVWHLATMRRPKQQNDIGRQRLRLWAALTLLTALALGLGTAALAQLGPTCTVTALGRSARGPATAPGCSPTSPRGVCDGVQRTLPNPAPPSCTPLP